MFSFALISYKLVCVVLYMIDKDNLNISYALKLFRCIVGRDVLFTYRRETNNGCTDFDETLFLCSANAVFVLVKEAAKVPLLFIQW